MANPHLTATCDRTGIRPACAVVDFATEPFAACTVDEDCVLATPRCCACGEIPIYDTIAVRSDANLDAVLSRRRVLPVRRTSIPARRRAVRPVRAWSASPLNSSRRARVLRPG